MVCIVCKNIKSTLCASCKKVRYCSRTCQRTHWAVHKKLCKMMRNIEKKDNSMSCFSESKESRDIITNFIGKLMFY